MKKFLVISSLLLVTSFSLFQLNANNEQLAILTENEVNTEVACKYRQCNATAVSTGKTCRHCVSKSTHYQCWQHR